MEIRLGTLAAIGVAALGTGALLASGRAAAQIRPIRPAATSSTLAAGSWFGRAIPTNTVCTKAQDPNCQVPNEIIVAFTIFEDHTFIGIDSTAFSGGSHTTAHGQWRQDSSNSITALFTLMVSASNGVFVGSVTDIFTATMTGEDSMDGTFDAYVYLYTRPDGSAIVGADGLPTPNPLNAPTCVAPGCQHLGVFSFKAKRVKSL